MGLFDIFKRAAPKAFGFESWAQVAEQELLEKQQALTSDYGLGRWDRWDADLANGKLTFSHEGRVRLVASIQIVGTRGSEDWLWAWANESLPPAYCADALLTRTFGHDFGVDVLSSPSVKAADLDAMAWRLTAATAKLTDALGAYRGPTGRGESAVFFTIKSLILTELN
ncbi:DUF6882 domain-containing protein [Caulobacter mirabilis]|uniref:Uncharacterized protein n=1 Tax=Caulobacter mirabilis TaxID=69666 RepID=A0A2D2AW18_9CAUL|nr:DUF6882 domain-containing protein [Caulobacter mirabilis]ATQ42193.1 hypothetical protein CSW64_07075 [Caulobacter mirabilis]